MVIFLVSLSFSNVFSATDKLVIIIICKKSLFDNSIEGLKLVNKPVFSVQYHPEANPGPQDSKYLFNDFIKVVKKYAKKKRH